MTNTKLVAGTFAVSVRAPEVYIQKPWKGQYNQGKGYIYSQDRKLTIDELCRVPQALVWKYKWDLNHSNLEQMFVQWELDNEVCMRLPPDSKAMMDKVVQLLEQASWQIRILQIPKLSIIGCWQLNVDRQLDKARYRKCYKACNERVTPTGNGLECSEDMSRKHSRESALDKELRWTKLQTTQTKR